MDCLFFVGRNPRDHQQRTLIYALSNGGSAVVGIPGKHVDDHLHFVDFPIAKIGYRHSDRLVYFDFATGRFSSTEH
jgi:hypothetical protein